MDAVQALTRLGGLARAEEPRRFGPRAGCPGSSVSAAPPPTTDGNSRPSRSFLRSGRITHEALRALQVRGAGADRLRRVVHHADGRAANPFESVLRAQCIDAGLVVEPQVAIDLGSGTVHPDLLRRELSTAIEADSWGHHGSRRAHTRGCACANSGVASRGGRTGWPVGRVLSRHTTGATIHLGRPLPVASSGLPACSGGPPSVTRAPGTEVPDFLTLLQVGFA